MPCCPDDVGCFTYQKVAYAGFAQDKLNNWGVQFHPERSGQSGQEFFRAFLSQGQ